tara:strand:- start:481 stop:1161 length:681 start_codon:yes stop_codon:yes gene_type:complete
MTQTLNEYLAVSTANIPIIGFIINIILSSALAFLLGWVYVKYGNPLSNRKRFANNFYILCMTTMFIITVVKSSLALSLGLVGALSIIRFRAAIKEPEELVYLFLSMAIGLGFGANQTQVTIIAFAIICGIIMVVSKNSSDNYENQNLHLTISSSNTKKLGINNIIDILKKECSVVDLTRLYETNQVLEATFNVEAQDFSKLNKSKESMLDLYNDVKITFIDNKGFM